MPRDIVIDPDALGLCIGGMLIDPPKTGMWMKDAIRMNNGFLWRADGHSKPCYQYVHLKVGEGYRVCMFITFPRRILPDVDKASVLYQETIAITDKAVRLDRKLFIFRKAMYTHHDEFQHMMDNMVPGAILHEPYDFLAEFASLMKAMYVTGQSVSEKPLRECEWCKTITEGRMKQCSCRRGVRYCSVECQRKHWSAGHKAECSQAAGLTKKVRKVHC